MTADILKQVRTLQRWRDWLNMSQKTGASCSAQFFRVDAEILSGHITLMPI